MLILQMRAIFDASTFKIALLASIGVGGVAYVFCLFPLLASTCRKANWKVSSLYQHRSEIILKGDKSHV